MPSLKYIIELSAQDKAELIDIVTKGKRTARTILRANILLASDRGSERYMTVSGDIKSVSHHANNRADCEKLVLREGT